MRFILSSCVATTMLCTVFSSQLLIAEEQASKPKTRSQMLDELWENEFRSRLHSLHRQRLDPRQRSKRRECDQQIKELVSNPSSLRDRSEFFTLAVPGGRAEGMVELGSSARLLSIIDDESILVVSRDYWGAQQMERRQKTEKRIRLTGINTKSMTTDAKGLTISGKYFRDGFYEYQSVAGTAEKVESYDLVSNEEWDESWNRVVEQKLDTAEKRQAISDSQSKRVYAARRRRR